MGASGCHQHGGAKQGTRGLGGWLRRSRRESACSTQAEEEGDGCVSHTTAGQRWSCVWPTPPWLQQSTGCGRAARRAAQNGPFSLQRQRELRLFTYRQTELWSHLGRQPGSAADQSLQDWIMRHGEKRENYSERRAQPLLGS